MFYSTRIIAALLFLSLLAACGQKGPLFYAPQSVPYRPLADSGGVVPAPVALPAAPASAAK